MSSKLLLKLADIVFKDYIEIDGYKYFVDGKRVVMEASKKEITVAKWLSLKLNKQIEILPRIALPKNRKTADYLIAS